MALTPPPGGLLESRVERVSVGPHSNAILYVECPLSFVASPLPSFLQLSPTAGGGTVLKPWRPAPPTQAATALSW